MRVLIFLACVCVVGCVSKTKWEYQGGGEQITTKSGEKVVRVLTEWGSIDFQPTQIHSQMAPVKIVVRNRSNQTIAIDETMFFLKDNEGYTVNLLSKSEATQRLQAQGAYGASLAAGNAYGLNNAVASQFVNEHSKNMFAFGKMRPRSAKRGIIYFPANDYKRASLKIFFSTKLKANNEFISFKNATPKRSVSSKRRR